MAETTPAAFAVTRKRITFGGSQTSVITYGVAMFLRRHRFYRATVAAAGVICALIWVIGFLKPGVFAFSYIFGLTIAPWLIYVAVIADEDFELTFPVEQAAQERQHAEAAYLQSNTPHDALKLDFSRLNEYYIINQTQARASFRWAVITMLLGFVTVIIGIWIFFFQHGTGDTFIASLATAAGIVVNIISTLFLYLFTKTQSRSLFYFKQLSRLQRIGVAIRLLDSHTDSQELGRSRSCVIRELMREQMPRGTSVARRP